MRVGCDIAVPLEINCKEEAEAADNSTFSDLKTVSKKWNCFTNTKAQELLNDKKSLNKFIALDEVMASDKVISFVPGRDGQLYEIRKTELGVFTTQTRDCDLLSVVGAGFEPALPLIPLTTIKRIISLFRLMMQVDGEFECPVNIYWDKEINDFIINIPRQVVSKASVCGSVSEELAGSRYLHYMDIHAHNSMKAAFSLIDDSDEKATRVYAVIGRLDKFLTDINVRISNGGKYLNIVIPLFRTV